MKRPGAHRATRHRRRTDIAHALAMLDALVATIPPPRKPLEIEEESSSGPNAGKFPRNEASDTACGGTEDEREG